MSLAQFSNNLMSNEFQGRQKYVGSAADDVSPDVVGQKRFATEVVAAMSNPRSWV